MNVLASKHLLEEHSPTEVIIETFLRNDGITLILHLPYVFVINTHCLDGREREKLLQAVRQINDLTPPLAIELIEEISDKTGKEIQNLYFKEDILSTPEKIRALAKKGRRKKRNIQ